MFQQPALPKYRYPIFKKLSSIKYFDVEFWISDYDTALPKIETSDFNTFAYNLTNINLIFTKLVWDPIQWKSSSRSDIDVLVLSWNIRVVSLLPSIVKARLNNKVVVLWGHGYSKHESKLSLILRDFVGKCANALVFYDYNSLDNFKIRNKKTPLLTCAPNTIDTTEINNAIEYWKSRPDDLLNFKFVNSLIDTTNIIYIGRFFPENNLVFLLNQMPNVLLKRPNTKLILIGKINTHANSLMKLASDLNITNSIIFAGELYNEIDIAPFMLCSKFFCYPDNIGLSLIHSFAYNLPVLTSDNIKSHNPEIFYLENGKNGLLYKHANNEDFLYKALYFLESDIHDYNINCKKTIKYNCSVDNMINGFEEAIVGSYNEN